MVREVQSKMGNIVKESKVEKRDREGTLIEFL
jgi:hypothetical protein